MVSCGILGRYLARSIAVAVLQVGLLLLALFIGIDLVRESRHLGPGYGFAELFGYVAATVPARLYDVFPFAVLIGVMIGMARLAGQRELVAMRACGFHRARIVAQVLGTGLALGLAVMLLGETLAPRLELKARIERAQRAGEVVGMSANDGLWLRDGLQMVRIGLLLWSRDGYFEFGDLSIYRLADDGVALEGLLNAGSATHRDGRWLLEQATQLDLASGAVTTHALLELDSVLEIDLFRALATRPRLLPARDILQVIAHLRANGQDASAYSQALWRRLYYPLNLLAMIVAGVALLLRHDRALVGSVAAFLGVSIGVGFIVVQRLILGAAATLPVPPALLQLIPPLLFGVLAWVLSRQT